MKQFGNFFPSIESARRAANAAAARAGLTPRSQTSSPVPPTTPSTLNHGEASRSPPLSPGPPLSPTDPLSPRSPCAEDGLGAESFYPIDPYIIRALTREELQVLMIDVPEAEEEGKDMSKGNDDNDVGPEGGIKEGEDGLEKEEKNQGMIRKKVQLQEPSLHHHQPPYSKQQQQQHKRGGGGKKEQEKKRIEQSNIREILLTLKTLVDVSAFMRG